MLQPMLHHQTIEKSVIYDKEDQNDDLAGTSIESQNVFVKKWYYDVNFQHRRCSSSHSNLRGIHSTPSIHSIHPLRHFASKPHKAIQPIPMVFNGVYQHSIVFYSVQQCQKCSIVFNSVQQCWQCSIAFNSVQQCSKVLQIGRAHVRTPVTA